MMTAGEWKDFAGAIEAIDLGFTTDHEICAADEFTWLTIFPFAMSNKTMKTTLLDTAQSTIMEILDHSV